MIDDDGQLDGMSLPWILQLVRKTRCLAIAIDVDGDVIGNAQSTAVTPYKEGYRIREVVFTSLRDVRVRSIIMLDIKTGVVCFRKRFQAPPPLGIGMTLTMFGE